MRKFNLNNKILFLALLFGGFGLWLPVFVLADSQSLSVNLEAIPSAACASLNNVSLKATIFGITSDYATYFFDCTNDGIWEEIKTERYNSYKICDYPSPGTYTAKVKVEKQGFTAENTVQIRVYFCGSQPSVPSYSSYSPLSPTIDIKANGSNGPIVVPYNTSANLTWTSANADYCYASGDWSGTKSISGSQTTGSLSSSKIYTIICTGSGGSVSDWVTVNVGAQVSADFLINKTVRNLSKGTAFSELIYADPREVLIFGIVVKAGNDPLYNVVVKDFLPSGITYIGDLKVDNILTSGDILTGLNVGNLSTSQEKTITFRADVAGAESFTFGQTQLTNTASVSSGSISYSDTAKVIVSRGAVAGAATDVSTGLTNNIFLDSFFLPLMITLLIILLFKSHIIKFEEWLDLRKKEYQIYKSKKILQLKIVKIKTKEFFQKII